MARFFASAEILEHVLDLPEDTHIIGVSLRLTGHGSLPQRELVFETEGGPFPDADIVLTYSTDEHGRVSLAGFTPVSL